MTANLMLAAWAVVWTGLVVQLKGRAPLDGMDAAALFALVGFPCLCVLAARHLP